MDPCLVEKGDIFGVRVEQEGIFGEVREGRCCCTECGVCNFLRVCTLTKRAKARFRKIHCNVLWYSDVYDNMI